MKIFGLLLVSFAFGGVLSLVVGSPAPSASGDLQVIVPARPTSLGGITITFRNDPWWEIIPEKKEIIRAAEAVAKFSNHREITPLVLVGLVAEESTMGKNAGKPRRAFNKSKTIREQVILDLFAEKWGGDIQDIPLSHQGAMGLSQIRPEYYIYHCGVQITFGDTPKVLLHGTRECRTMSRSERHKGVAMLQWKLGFRGDDIDGKIGPATLTRIRQVTGRRYFDRGARFLLLKKYFEDQVKITFNRNKDKVFQMVCRVKGLDPNETPYFAINPWDPLHALAYSVVHLEDDMYRAGEGIAFGLAAYNWGYSPAKRGRGTSYRDRVLEKGRKHYRSS